MKDKSFKQRFAAFATETEPQFRKKGSFRNAKAMVINMALRLKKTLAEFIGTLFCILIGCGSVMALKTDYKNGCAYLVVALAFPAAYAAVYYMFSHICDAHFNPAVSFSSLILGDISFLDFIFYLVGQLSGAFAACGLLLGIFYGHTGTFGANEVYDDSTWLSLLVEFLLALFFILARISGGHNDKSKAGIVSGIALFAVSAVGIQLTLTSANPARSIACAIFAGGDYIMNVWPFIVGPFIAAAVASLIHLILKKSSDDISETRSKEKITDKEDSDISEDVRNLNNDKIQDLTQ